MYVYASFQQQVRAPGPPQGMVLVRTRGRRSHTRRLVSQDAEAKDVPSGDTLTQLTRFSWPNRTEIRFPFRTSHTLMV